MITFDLVLHADSVLSMGNELDIHIHHGGVQLRQTSLQVVQNGSTNIYPRIEKCHEMRTVTLLSSFYRLLPFFEIVADGFEVFRRVEACFSQVIQ